MVCRDRTKVDSRPKKLNGFIAAVGRQQANSAEQATDVLALLQSSRRTWLTRRRADHGRFLDSNGNLVVPKRRCALFNHRWGGGVASNCIEQAHSAKVSDMEEVVKMVAKSVLRMLA